MWLVLLVGLVCSPSAVDAAVLEFRKILTCGSLTSKDCAQKVLAGLETPGSKLHADAAIDTVQGSVTIIFNDPPVPSIIRVEFYDQDDGPTDVRLPNGQWQHLRTPGPRGAHLSTLKRPLVMPSEQDVKDKLSAVVLP